MAGTVAGNGGGQAGDVDHAVVHHARVAVPARVVAQGGEDVLVAGEEPLRLVDPGLVGELGALDSREGWVERRALVAEKGGLEDELTGQAVSGTFCFKRRGL